MRKRLPILLCILLLLIGVAVLAYPAVSNAVNRKNGSYAIQELKDQISRAGEEELAHQRRLAEEYNAALLAGVEPQGYEEILNITGGMMGYIRIPKINVDLPIYHGTSEEVLAKGVGHMPESAFPIGGEGNHAVLTGHTGHPSAELFTDISDLEIGDTFSIYILEEIITYEIDQIKVVLPTQSQDLVSVPGEDLCTLVTCTPYGINSHRLLVRGSRIE